MTELSARIAALSPAKRALLDRSLGDLDQDGGVAVPPRRPRTARAPATVTQARMWAVQASEPASTALNIRISLRLAGALQLPAFLRSLEGVVRRHEALRTRFAEVDGRVVQIVEETVVLAVPVRDVRALPESDRSAAVERVLADEADTPFALATAPLVRARVLRLADADHILLLTFHHIVCDGWSMAIFARELASLYAAECDGRAAALAAPPEIQLADFGAWQRRWLDGPRRAEHADYWRRELANAPAWLDVPSRIPRPPAAEFAFGYHCFAVDRAAVDAVKYVASTSGGTLFMTLLAVFAAVLCRRTGQHDLLIGTPIAGRQQRELEDVVGMFGNTVILRIDMAGDPSLREGIQRVRAVAQRAYAHQSLPIEEVVRIAGGLAPANRAPLFQVKFALHNFPRGDEEFRGLEASAVGDGIPTLPFHLYSPLLTTAKLDLCFALSQRPDGLSGLVEFNERVLDAETVVELTEEFLALLADAVRDPAAPLVGAAGGPRR